VSVIVLANKSDVGTAADEEDDQEREIEVTDEDIA